MKIRSTICEILLIRGCRHFSLSVCSVTCAHASALKLPASVSPWFTHLRGRPSSDFDLPSRPRHSALPGTGLSRVCHGSPSQKPLILFACHGVTGCRPPEPWLTEPLLFRRLGDFAFSHARNTLHVSAPLACCSSRESHGNPRKPTESSLWH
jgi:hypothetical protein